MLGSQYASMEGHCLGWKRTGKTLIPCGRICIEK